MKIIFFFKAKIDISIFSEKLNEKKTFPIEVLKICKHSYELNDVSIDICHAIFIIFAVCFIIF